MRGAVGSLVLAGLAGRCFSPHHSLSLFQTLVETLTPKQIELAAQGSYAYWLATISPHQQPTDAERLRMATREARRFLGSPTLEVAERLLKETCAFREERRIDLIRSCFMEEGTVEYDNDDELLLAHKYRYLINNDLSKQSAYVRGRDKDGRALLIVHPRTQTGTDDDEFVLSQLYLMERAIAVTEYESVGRIEKITAVFDFNNFQSSLAPNFEAVKSVSGILQNRYSERLQKLVITDPPFWMRAAYGVLKPFLDPVTSAKFIMVSGSKRKQQVIADLIDEDQAMPFLLPSGKLIDKVDDRVFIQHVPFYRGYDRRYGEQQQKSEMRIDDDDDIRRCIKRTISGTICSGSFEFDGKVSVTVG